MSYFISLVIFLYSGLAFAEEGLNTTLKSVEQQILELNTTLFNVEDKIDETGLNLQQKQNEEVKIRKKLVKQLNTFNKTVKDTIRIQRLPQKALFIVDGLNGHNKRRNILEKGQKNLQTKIKNDKKMLSSLLKNLSEQEKMLADLTSLRENLIEKQTKFNKLRKIQIKLLTLKDEEKDKLIAQAKKLEKLLNLNGIFNKTKNNLVKKHSTTNISYHNMPVTGIIISNYKQKDEKGIHSQGISILATPSAEVKAIQDGHVIYSNIFREYGYLVILEHSDGYHTLYSGLNGGTKEIGDFISAGDTIGILPAIEKPKLYLEVRKDGVAVNPNQLLKIKKN